ncbi:MAG TPA: carboxypeptidase-like regulatory domain-containing protein, partial [Terriglobales bacterium]|nr:carboxypeptidase-like regulatory domain-containing protein [Terriglobales bacterium]
MSQRSVLPFYLTVIATFLVLTLSAPLAFSQHGSEGTVAVTVLDPSGSVVPGAQLELTDVATGNSYKGVTASNGSHTFVNLNLGRYRLTIVMNGFQKQVFDNVISQAAQTTDVSATLKIGTQGETVEVNASATPVIEESSNAIGTTIDLKQIEDLPIFGRDLTQLSQLVPGYTGTWDGLPSIAQGNNIDGVIGSSSRMKFGGNSEPAVVPRLEDIEEMTVQTEQLNLDQGFGQANMQINFITRRGTNNFHGRIFEDFRNTALDANSWLNDAATSLDPSNPQKKNPLILNEFGGSLGGPIIKDKLFFFGTFAMSKQPGSISATNFVFTPAAQQGNFSYVGTDNALHTVNLFTLAQNYNGTNPSANLPTAVNSTGTYSPGAILQTINNSLKGGSLTPNGNGDPNLQTLLWQVPNPTTWYYPTVRVDYTPDDKMRFNLAWNMTKQTNPGQDVPDFPGP